MGTFLQEGLAEERRVRLRRLGEAAPFVARRAVNLHGCALPHCAPLLRLLR
jgi:hypothetical protein